MHSTWNIHGFEVIGLEGNHALVWVPGYGAILYRQT